MPEIIRQQVRMNSEAGLDLVSPVDRMPPGAFQRLTNVRAVQEGRLDGRPGYTTYGNGVGGPKLLHSIRRLNDEDRSVAAAGYSYVVGNGTTIDAGVETSLVQVDTGYSGNPLSLIPFRPEVTPESWMYCYDSLKQSKINGVGTVRPIGVVPPNAAPAAEYGIPCMADLDTGQTVGAWVTDGTSFTGAVAQTNRLPSAGWVISVPTGSGANPLYDSGSTGWCCFEPASASSGDYSWAGERTKIIFDSGGGNEETVMIREIHPAVNETGSFAISSISYDSGSTGLCTIVPNSSIPEGLDRNSLIGFVAGGERVRVLSVTYNDDGTTYSFRCSTVSTHAAGDSMVGKISWRVYTTKTHVSNESITTKYLLATQAVKGSGYMTVTQQVDAGKANGRPMSIADDYIHCSLFISAPLNLVNVTLRIDIDPGTSAATTPVAPFTNNYLQLILTVADLQALGLAGTNSWVEIVKPLSSFTRFGNNSAYTLRTVNALSVGLTSTDLCNIGFDWFYVFGTYGPVIQPNAPTGYLYSSRFRDSTTGAASIPGPTTRYSLFPLREDVLVTPGTTSVAGIDYSDIYRQGGTVADFAYLGSVINNNSVPNTFTDGLPDLQIATNPSPDLTLVQPWPVLGIPISGVVNVTGTTVRWVSGSTFPTSLIANSVILLNGKAFQTYGNPHSSTFLELVADGGSLTSATYSIESPTLAGQPLPVVFGPLEGPFQPYAFAVGDTVNPGTLYYSNAGNFDAASDANTIDICGSGEILITGETWNGLVFCGSDDNVFMARYGFLQSPGSAPFQFVRLPSPAGFWSPWAICRGPDGVYALGRDGIYRWTEQGGTNVSDKQLYPLFPHDGQPAAGANGYLPVDMSQTNFMRMVSHDGQIRFLYLDSSGAQQSMCFDTDKKVWYHKNYADAFSYEYLDEVAASDTGTGNFDILYLSRTLGNIYASGGNTDNGTVITSIVQPPYFDNEDERSQKLYVDFIVDADQVGTVSVVPYFNNGVTVGPTTSLVYTGSRAQQEVNISSVPGGLNLYRNMSIYMSWTGGPAGPRVYAVEPSLYMQAYLSKRITTQYTGLSFPGWKHLRRATPALISNSAVTWTIYCQNGRNFTVTIPSTGGKLLIQPIMVPQTCKDLAFAFQLDAGGAEFALFPDDFTVEAKEWVEGSYVKLGIFRS